MSVTTRSPLQVSFDKIGVARCFARRLSRLQRMSEADIDAAVSGLRVEAPLPSHVDVAPRGCVSVVLSGIVCRYSLLSDGQRQLNGFILPGDVCEYGFLSDCSLSQRLMTLGQSQLGYIDLTMFTHIAERYPNVMSAMLRGVAADFAMLQQLVLSLGRRTALERVAHLMCELHYRFGQVDLLDEGAFKFPVTQAEIGECLGLSTVHVNRTVQEIRRQGLIHMQAGAVLVRDLPRLREMARFDPAYLNPRPFDLRTDRVA